MVVVPVDADELKTYKKEMEKSKRLILDGVRDHMVSDIASKDTVRQMWEALGRLYQGSSEQRKMYLEEKLRCTRMQKGERIDPFLTRIQDVGDQLSAVGSVPQPTKFVQLALNNVSKGWQVFVESILGKDKLPEESNVG